MNREERLGVSMKLIETALNEGKTTNSLEVELKIKGGETFNGNIADIQILASNLPPKTLVEMSIDILTAELRASSNAYVQ